MDIDEYINCILHFSKMEESMYDNDTENILIVNPRKKFTYLNFTNIYYSDIPIFALDKMRKEYGSLWEEEDERIHSIIYVKSI